MLNLNLFYFEFFIFKKYLNLLNLILFFIKYLNYHHITKINIKQLLIIKKYYYLFLSHLFYILLEIVNTNFF